MYSAGPDESPVPGRGPKNLSLYLRNTAVHTDIGILSELSNFNSLHRNLSEIIGNAQNRNN